MNTLEKFEKQEAQEVTFKVPSVPEIEALSKFCGILSQSAFYQKLGPSGVFAIYVAAKEMNLPFMSCLNGGMFVVDGKVTLSTQMMNFLIISKGHKIDIIQLTEKECVLKFIRKDGRFYEHSFTQEDAQRAGLLGKDNWRKYPKDMLFNRCLATGARKFLPDAILNTYIHGEVDEEFSNKEKNMDNFDPCIEKIPLLTHDQVAEIKSLLDGREDVEQVLMNRMQKSFGVSRLEEVSAVQYENVIKAINILKSNGG